MDNLFSGNCIPSTSSGRPIASQLSSAACNASPVRQAVTPDERLEGGVASTKGTLSDEA